LVAVVVVDQTVETVAVAVSFDSVLPLAHGYLQLEQNLHSKWARVESVVAGLLLLVVLQAFFHRFLGEGRHVLLQILELVVVDGHLLLFH
jgi:hypothetical protein